MKRVRGAVLAVVALVIVAATAGAEDTSGYGIFGQAKPAIGFIFNTDSILFDIESYQAGFGAKIRLGPAAWRPFADVFFSTISSTFSLGVGAAYERHLQPGRISPYVGGLVNLDSILQQNTTDAANWTRNINLAFTAGALAGVEFFILRNVSIFAEYNLAANLQVGIDSTSAASVVTTTADVAFTLDSKIGNAGKLGVVIYLE
jgi:hypothetical protein